MLDKLKKGEDSTNTATTSTHKGVDETSFIDNVDEHSPLKQREGNLDEAWDRIKTKNPLIYKSMETILDYIKLLNIYPQ